MNINKIVNSLHDCSCGRQHISDIKCVEIGHGVLNECAAILNNNGFPHDILAVTDTNELKAAKDILNRLKSGGFNVTLLEFDNLRIASQNKVETVFNAVAENNGILSIGSGSCNDICRRAAFLKEIPFAIFATAPSMDGFASSSSPITDKNFKVSLPARQPKILLGDTEILATAPTELKSAGFGDMIAKCIAVSDWRISNLITGEYYCPKIAQLTREAFTRISLLSNNVTKNDELTAGAIMETLILTGMAMQFSDNSRPASGAEHIVSHYWEIRELENGHLSDYHGKKVGLATLYIARLYYDMVNYTKIDFTEDTTDWDMVYSAYGSCFKNNIIEMNSPTITKDIDPNKLRNCWSSICDIVKEEIPNPEVIESLLKSAAVPVSYDEINISRALAAKGLKYHPYMRHRLTLSRLIPMTNYSPDYQSLL